MDKDESSILFNAATNTLTVHVKTANWTPAMEKVYRFLCAPANPTFLEESFRVVKSLTKLQMDTIALRLANTPGLDARANCDFIEGLVARLQDTASQ